MGGKCGNCASCLHNNGEEERVIYDVTGTCLHQLIIMMNRRKTLDARSVSVWHRYALLLMLLQLIALQMHISCATHTHTHTHR